MQVQPKKEKHQKNDSSFINHENPFFAFIPKGYFRFRDAIFSPFHIKLHKNMSSGLFLLHLLLLGLYGLFVGLCSKTTLDEDQYKLEGVIASIIYGLSGVFAMRNSITVFLTGMSYETEMKVHRIFAFYGLATGLFHGIRAGYEENEVISYHNITGFILIDLVFVLICIGFMFKFWKGFYTLFMNIHRWILLAMFVLSILHGAVAIILITGIAYLFDILTRIFFMQRAKKKLDQPKYIELKPDYVKISFVKKSHFKFKPNQFCYLYCPKFEWTHAHPFSITNSPDEDLVEFIIKREKRWTNKLYQAVVQGNIPNIYVDGPYGGTNINLDDISYEYFVLIGGGIGITPLLSVCKYLQGQTDKRSIKGISLIHTSRNELLKEEISLIKSRDEQNIISITNNCTTVTKKRLEIPILLEQDSNKAKKLGCKKMAIFVCGPKRMIDDVYKSSQVIKDIIFRINFEEFDPLESLFF